VTVGAAVMGRWLAGTLSATTYEIWVGGVQVTDDNKDDVLGTADGDGATVTYNPTDGILTLNGATIPSTANYSFSGSDGTYGIYATQDLKIQLEGANSVTAAGSTRALMGTPNLSGYANVAVTSSTNYDGTSPTTYNGSNISTYKYLKVEPAAGVSEQFNLTPGDYTFDRYGVTADVPKNLRYTTYSMQKGDSFWSISRKLDCPMSELERLNNKSRFSLILPGDVLRVPKK